MNGGLVSARNCHKNRVIASGAQMNNEALERQGRQNTSVILLLIKCMFARQYSIDKNRFIRSTARP
jgi:hypothetical protein